MPGPDVIDIAGNKFVVGPGVVPRTLFTSTANLAGRSLHESDTGADYQIPAGKTLTVYSIQYVPSASNRSVRIIQASAADSTTGEIIKIPTVYVGAPGGGGAKFQLGVQVTFAENTYVNAVLDSNSASPTVILVGVES